jgi:hypothetical protein
MLFPLCVCARGLRKMWFLGRPPLCFLIQGLSLPGQQALYRLRSRTPEPAVLTPLSSSMKGHRSTSSGRAKFLAQATGKQKPFFVSSLKPAVVLLRHRPWAVDRPAVGSPPASERRGRRKPFREVRKPRGKPRSSEGGSQVPRRHSNRAGGENGSTPLVSGRMRVAHQ